MRDTELIRLYVQSVLFNPNPKYNSLSKLSFFKSAKNEIVFEITAINSAFIVADALGKNTATFTLNLTYTQPFDNEAAFNSLALPDALTFRVTDWNQQKLENMKDILYIVRDNI